MAEITPAAPILVLIATACAALAHFIWGRCWRQLPVFWLAAMLGCLLAYGLGLHIPITLNLPAIGGVPVLEAILSAWMLIFIAARLRV